MLHEKKKGEGVHKGGGMMGKERKAESRYEGREKYEQDKRQGGKDVLSLVG